MLLQATLVSFLLICGSGTVPTVSSLELDFKGDDCCQLKWLPLIERGSKRFIPSSGVSVTSANGTRWFYFMKEDQRKFAIISEEVDKLPIFLEDSRREGPWEGGLVLSNPHNCVLGWQRFDRGAKVWQTPDK